MYTIMERSSYEKLSIRDSARSLKKYGSTSKHVTRNDHCIKHYVANGETLQGIALKYDVTIEQIRRINRLWASDSLFLKEFLLIPVVPSNAPRKSDSNSVEESPSQVTSPTSQTSISSFDDDSSIDDFLGKIDAAIASTKADVKKTQKNSEFVNSWDGAGDRRKPAVSRLKQTVNNNGTSDLYPAPQAVVVQHGRKVKASLRQHERQQDELFEL